jgi:hypothetical protein
MPEPVEDWSLTGLKEKLVNIGAKVASQWRYAAFQKSEVAIPRNLFADILRLFGEFAASVRYIDGVIRSIVTRSTKTTADVCLDDRKFGILGVPPRAGSPRVHLQATAGSQRDFSLAKVLVCAQSRSRKAVIPRTAG